MFIAGNAGESQYFDFSRKPKKPESNRFMKIQWVSSKGCHSKNQ